MGLDTRAGSSRSRVAARLIRALIKADDAWPETYDALRRAYTRAWRDGLKKGIAAALAEMLAWDDGPFTTADAAKIMARLEEKVGGQALQEALSGPVINLTPALYGIGGSEAARAAGVDFVFGKADKMALAILTDGNLYWIGNSWNGFTQNLLDRALIDYFEEGMTRAQLAARLADDFAGLSQRGTKYWELLADHAATKTREMGRVSGYEQAGARYVQVRAHLDHRTTEICRAMHGRVISVSRLREQTDEYLTAMKNRDVIAAKQSWVMHKNAGQVAGVSTKDLPKGTAAPPYHFRCRTITVAWVEDEAGDTGRWKRATYDREPLDKKETARLVERCKTAGWKSKKELKKHYDKHGGEIWKSLDAYNQAAIDRIRRGNRDVYLAVRRGRLRAMFVSEYKKGSATKFEITIVDVADNRLVSQHRRPRLETKYNDVQPVKQPGKGIMKWLFG